MQTIRRSTDVKQTFRVTEKSSKNKWIDPEQTLECIFYWKQKFFLVKKQDNIDFNEETGSIICIVDKILM